MYSIYNQFFCIQRAHKLDHEDRHSKLQLTSDTVFSLWDLPVFFFFFGGGVFWGEEHGPHNGCGRSLGTLLQRGSTKDRWPGHGQHDGDAADELSGEQFPRPRKGILKYIKRGRVHHLSREKTLNWSFFSFNVIFCSVYSARLFVCHVLTWIYCFYSMCFM